MNKPLFFVFPGQGSQKVGMGLDLYKNHKVAKEVFDEVDDSLNQKLSEIIFYGSEEELRFTPNTQPALMVVSIAITRILEYELKKNISEFVKIVAGHSLGEYSALCSTGSLTLKDTTKLLRERGNSMQNAVKDIETKMTAVIGLDLNKVEESIKNCSLGEGEQCEIANDNCPGQIIISGTTLGVDKVSDALKKHGARSLIDLNVSAPFHCSLMKSASLELKEIIINSKLEQVHTDFISNVTANYEKESEKIKELLVEQIFSRVRWRETILLAEKSNAKIIEVGSGKVLTGINKRINRDIEVENISNLSEIELFLKKNQKSI